MKSFYKRENLKITEFDAEDVSTTSGLNDSSEKENAYGSYDEFDTAPGAWY